MKYLKLYNIPSDVVAYNESPSTHYIISESKVYYHGHAYNQGGTGGPPTSSPGPDSGSTTPGPTEVPTTTIAP